MQYVPYSFFADDSLPKDDVDRLFEQLEQIEPPSSLITQILKNITGKNRYKSSPDVADPESLPWDELDSLVVRNEKLGPS
jgi:hypothetical protein